MILAWPSSVTMTLAGFRSRCTTPFSWARARPSAISIARSRARAGAVLALGQEVAQLLAADELHGDEGDAVRFVDAVDDRDVGVLEGGGGLGLAQEALAPVGVLRELLGEDLEGHFAVELGVDRHGPSAAS